MPAKIKEIWMNRAEGLIEECYEATVTSWEAANHLFSLWGHTAPEMGYDKCDVRVTWEGESETYDLRFDLHKTGTQQETPSGRIDLAERILAFLQYLYKLDAKKLALQFDTTHEGLREFVKARDWGGCYLAEKFQEG